MNDAAGKDGMGSTNHGACKLGFYVIVRTAGANAYAADQATTSEERNTATITKSHNNEMILCNQ